MSFEFTDLDSLRSIEELTNHQNSVRSRLTEIDKDYAGLPLPDAERDSNLQMLKFISEQTVARGLQFQLGIWMHGYQWINSPNPNYTITGLTAADQAAYSRDALTLLPFLPRGSHGIADVGSGGGVPGIPLAIVRPDAQVILIESTQKKARAVEAIVAELGLAVRVYPSRAEEVLEITTFDTLMARATIRGGTLRLMTRAVHRYCN